MQTPDLGRRAGKGRHPLSPGRPTLAVAACLLLAACTGTPGSVAPVSPFDVERYAGTWYEIARLDHSFERGLTNVTATYEIREDGSLSVVNRGYDRGRCEWDSVEGSARFLEGPDVASLAVTFLWPFAGGYHVFVLDRPGYEHAAVSGPTRDYFWILAREPAMPEPVYDDLVEAARIRGFPVDELIRVSHAPPDCPAAEEG